MPDALPELLFVQAKVLDAWDETPSLRALSVELGAELGAQHQSPGQVLQVRASGGAAGYFAIAGAPGGGRAELLIKRGGAVADSLIAAGVPGAPLEIAGPIGRGFPVAEARGRDVLLFAAGSGIAPIRALAQHLVAARDQFGRVDLFYGQREAGDFAYAAEHATWERAGVRVVLCASRGGDLWRGERGHVQDVARKIDFAAVPPSGAVAFVSGMKAMVAGVREVLAAAGLPASRVYLNY